MVVCTGDARQFRVNISMHLRSLLARAPVRNSLNLALPSGTRTCSQFTEYEYLQPPPKKSHRIYTIHVGHLFWYQNGEFRRKVRDFHAWRRLPIRPKRTLRRLQLPIRPKRTLRSRYENGSGVKKVRRILPLQGGPGACSPVRKNVIFHILKHQSDAFWEAFFANMGRAGET